MAAIMPTPPAGIRIWYSAIEHPQLSLPDGRKEVVRSVLNITKPMQFGTFVWDEAHIPAGPVWVILYGTDGKPTPTGTFIILQKDSDHHSRSYDAPMPFMLRLTKDGVAIHGSNVRQGWATHGCIGVPLDFARLLFAVASKGDPVVILAGHTEPGGTDPTG